jgi:hypothetical protein
VDLVELSGLGSFTKFVFFMSTTNQGWQIPQDIV